MLHYFGTNIQIFMNIERQFKIAAFLVVIVMVVVALIPFETNRATQQTAGKLQATLEREDLYNQLISALRDAETSQRGYIITGKDVFLKRHRVAISQLATLRSAILNTLGTSTSEQKTIQEILRVTDLKLAEIDETIEIRRTQGFAAVEPVISSERGKHLMDSLRQLIGQQLESYKKLREDETADLMRKSERELYVGSSVMLVSLTFLVLLLIYIFRTLKERQAIAQALQKAADQLSQSVAEAEIINEQMEVSAAMLHALSTVSTLADTAHIISIHCTKLFPKLSGTTYLYHNSRDALQRHSSWGPLPSLAEFLEPEECWALRLGRLHATHAEHDLRCSHHDTGALYGCLCVPLITRGEVIGIISMNGLPTDERQRQSQRQLVQRVAEQIALALNNVKLRETLRSQSIVDPLTGLFNRRYMDETLKRELARADRKQTSLSLIILDLDHFKRINDTFGHDAGDAVLKATARTLSEKTRESDLACRFGGEELVIILPDCGLDDAIKRAEQILATIEALHITHAGMQIGRVTASFGVATFPSHAADPPMLLRAADQALYLAKESGRNCVVAAPAYPRQSADCQ